MGDPVKAGQVLAKLDTTDLEMAVAKAQVALDSSKLQLQQTQAGPQPADVASAKASLASTQAAYQAALNKYSLSDAQLAVARPARQGRCDGSARAKCVQQPDRVSALR